MKVRRMVLFCIMLVFGATLIAGGAQAAVIVSAGKVVKLNYVLTVDGKVVDKTKKGHPFVVTIGQHQVIPGFEQGLMGMKVGQKKSFVVSPKEGYGEINPKAIIEIPKSKLPKDVKLTPGMTLYGQGADGRPFPVKIVKVNKDSAVVDLNNPMAGKTLHFAVQVLDIK